MEIFLIPVFIMGTIAILALFRQVVLSVGYVGFTSLIVLAAMIGIGDYNAGDPAAMESAYISLAVGMLGWLGVWFALACVTAALVVARKKDSLVHSLIDEARESYWNWKYAKYKSKRALSAAPTNES